MVALFVLLTVILFLIIDLLIQKVNAKKETASANNVNGNTLSIEAFRVPQGYFFYPGHTWANIQPSGNVLVGMDDFVQKLVGSIEEIKTKKPGESIEQGEPMLQIRQGNRLLELIAPVNGFITEVNETTVTDSSQLQKFPYTKGWIYKIHPTRLSKDISRLYIAEKSVAWFKSELNRLRDFLQSPALVPSKVGVTLQDGGILIGGLVSHLNDQAWAKFEANFLRR